MSMTTTELFPIRRLQSRTDALLENEVLVILLNMAGVETIVAICKNRPAVVLQYYMAEVVGVWHYRIALMLNNKLLGESVHLCELASRLEKSDQVINFLIKEPTHWGRW
jgi:hypothetical protein